MQLFPNYVLRTNILLDGHFVAKLGDLGFACRKPQVQGGRTVWMGETCGTQGYTAPEVASGEVSPKADVYTSNDVHCSFVYCRDTHWNDPAACLRPSLSFLHRIRRERERETNPGYYKKCSYMYTCTHGHLYHYSVLQDGPVSSSMIISVKLLRILTSLLLWLAQD